MRSVRAYHGRHGSAKAPGKMAIKSAAMFAASLVLLPSQGALAQSVRPSIDVGQTGGSSDQLWTFERLMRDVVTNNPRIKSQAATAEAATFDVAAARWQYFPTPAVQAESSGGDRQIVGSITQPLVTFGRIGADVKAAKSRAKAAEVRVDEARFLLAFRVLELYGQYAQAKRAEDVMRDDVTRLGDLGEMISRRVTAGVSAPVDLNLVLTRIRQSENAIISLRARQQSAREALQELLGKRFGQDEIVIPTAAVSTLVDGAGSADAAIERVLAYSPSLKRAERDIDVAKAEQSRALGLLKPTIFAKAEQRFDKGRYDFSSFPRSRLLFGVQYNFGSGLSSLERIKAASTQAEAARLSREAAQADARSALQTDMQTLAASRQLVESLRANLVVQQETVDSYNRLFLAGRRSWLDVLNTARELTSTQRELADAEMQALIAAYRIQIQTGEVQW